jgi:adenylate kinase family enzyme
MLQVDCFYTETNKAVDQSYSFFFLQVIDYYSKKGLVANLRAEKPPKEVTAEVQKTLS